METKLQEGLKLNEIIEGKVIAIDRTTVYIDLSPFGTGIIYGREFSIAKDILRKTKIGDSISAKIIELETPSGYIDLSLKEARNAFIWNEAEESMKTKRVYEVIVKDANRGGLVIEWNGIRGFLPASQLTGAHYPKVFDKNKDSIMNELKKLVGEKLQVSIDTIDPKNDTLIFIEHKDTNAPEDPDVPEIVYGVGDVKSGVVSGVVDFGVFVTLDNKVEGLVHISEMDWGLVDDPRRFYSVGSQVQVKIIGIENGKYSFSFKELQKNPWNEIRDKYKNGDTASGVILKYGDHGAFASIEAGVSGLVHISNFENEIELRNTLEIGKVYEFIIANLEASEQKLTLLPKKNKE